MLNQLIRLERPLAFLDLETTGLDAERDRIIQIGITMHYPHKDPVAWSTLVNPGIPITNQGSHQITDGDVKDAPKFSDFAAELAPRLLNADIAGHNVGTFDMKFMFAEMRRANVDFPWQNHIVCTLAICRLKIPHTLSNAYKRYVDPAGFEGAHDAGSDVAANIAVLAGQLREHQDLPRTVAELAEFCTNRNPNAIDKQGKFIWMGDEPCINFGKHKGKSLRKVDQGYLVWMINTPNFPDDAILIAGDALKGKYPVKGQ
jgi:DNA polymerase III subunit epsilon